MSNRYTEAELREYFYEALSEFQDRLDTDFNEDNIKLVFFVPENGIVTGTDGTVNEMPKLTKTEQSVLS